MADANGPRDDQGFKAEYATRQLSSAQTLTTAAFIAAPVSLIIGGMFLSIVALICGLVARSKIRSAIALQDEPSLMASRLLRQSRLSLFIAAAATAINIAYAVMLFPVMLEFLQSGDMQQALDQLGAAQGSSSASTSVWG